MPSILTQRMRALILRYSPSGPCGKEGVVWTTREKTLDFDRGRRLEGGLQTLIV